MRLTLLLDVGVYEAFVMLSVAFFLLNHVHRAETAATLLSLSAMCECLLSHYLENAQINRGILLYFVQAFIQMPYKYDPIPKKKSTSYPENPTVAMAWYVACRTSMFWLSSNFWSVL